jgi:hypothetical protein
MTSQFALRLLGAVKFNILWLRRPNSKEGLQLTTKLLRVGYCLCQQAMDELTTLPATIA